METTKGQPLRTDGKTPAITFGQALLIIFLLAYVVRALSYLFIKGTPVFDTVVGEALHFDYLAWRTVTTGQWLGGSAVPTAPPLILYYLTLIYSVLGRNYFALRLLGAAFGALLCVFIGLAGREMFCRRAGLAAAAIAAFYGPLVHFELTMPGTALILCLLVASVYLCLRSLRRDSLPGMLAAGACLGVSLLGRPNVGLLGAVMGLYTLTASRSFRRRVALAAVLAAGFLLAVLPPLAFNYHHFGEPILTPSYGIAFYLGNNLEADGRVRFGPIINTIEALDLRDFRDLACKETGRVLSWSGMANYWLAEGFRQAVSTPGRSLLLLVRKIGHIWEPHEFPIDASYGYYRARGFLPFPLLTMAQVAVLALPGLVCLRRRREDLFLVSLAAVGTLALALFVTASRYRLPVIFLAIILAGAAWARLPDVWRAGGWRRVAALILALIGLAAAFGPNPYAIEKYFSRDYLYMGNMYYQTGDYDGAIAYLEKAAAIYPRDAETRLAIAETRLKAGDLDGAIADYHRAIELGNTVSYSRTVPGYHDRLGDAYMKQGMVDEAVRQYQAALELNPYSYFLAAYTKLADIYRSRGQEEAARRMEAELEVHSVSSP